MNVGLHLRSSDDSGTAYRLPLGRCGFAVMSIGTFVVAADALILILLAVLVWREVFDDSEGPRATRLRWARQVAIGVLIGGFSASIVAIVTNPNVPASPAPPDGSSTPTSRPTPSKTETASLAGRATAAPATPEVFLNPTGLSSPIAAITKNATRAAVLLLALTADAQSASNSPPGPGAPIAPTSSSQITRPAAGRGFP